MNPGLDRLNTMPDEECRQMLYACCSSEQYAMQLAGERSWSDTDALLDAARRLWAALLIEEKIKSYMAHPRIGERRADESRFSDWSKREQAGVSAKLEELRADNHRYEEKFGIRFLIFASGKTGDEIHAELVNRLQNTKEEELAIASGEQMKITELRLTKLLESLSGP